MVGRIVKIIADKGYGFIQAPKPDDGKADCEKPDDIFFHCTALQDREIFGSLFVGQHVEFNLAEVDGRHRAESVRVLPQS